MKDESWLFEAMFSDDVLECFCSELLPKYGPTGYRNQSSKSLQSKVDSYCGNEGANHRVWSQWEGIPAVYLKAKSGIPKAKSAFSLELPWDPFWKRNIWWIESRKPYPKSRIRIVFVLRTFKESPPIATGGNLTIWFWTVYLAWVLKEEDGFVIQFNSWD